MLYNSNTLLVAGQFSDFYAFDISDFISENKIKPQLRFLEGYDRLDANPEDRGRAWGIAADEKHNLIFSSSFGSPHESCQGSYFSSPYWDGVHIFKVLK